MLVLHYIIKIEYLEDGFADIKYFEASQRLTYKPKEVNNLTFNFGAAQSIYRNGAKILLNKIYK